MQQKMGSLFLVAYIVLFGMCFEASSAAASGKEDVEELVAQLQDYLHMLDGGGKISTVDAVEQKAHSGLTMSSQNENMIEGSFVEDGNGIYFMCEDDGSGKGTLLLTTMEGKTIFYIEQIREDLVLVSVEEEALLYIPSTQTGGGIYEIPPSHFIGALKAMEGTTNFTVHRLQKYLQRVSENEGMEKLKKFMKFEEINMVIATSQALMDSTEESNTPPLSLRVLLAFFHFLHESTTVTAELEHRTAEFEHGSLFAHSTQATEVCTRFPTTCPLGECPFRRSGNNCFGMCGLQCNCWRFLCGDCCVHRGCREHDACCARGGFLASLRCAIPIGFNCNRRFRCP